MILTVISGVTSVVVFKYFWLIHLWIRQHKVVGLVLILKLFYLKNDPGFSEGVSCERLRMIHWLYESDSNHYLVSDFGGTSQIFLTHYKEPDSGSSNLNSLMSLSDYTNPINLIQTTISWEISVVLDKSFRFFNSSKNHPFTNQTTRLVVYLVLLADNQSVYFCNLTRSYLTNPYVNRLTVLLTM